MTMTTVPSQTSETAARCSAGPAFSGLDRVQYSEGRMSGSRVTIVRFPDGTVCTISELARHLGYPASTLRARRLKTDDPGKLVADLGQRKNQHRDIARRPDWREVIAGVKQVDVVDAAETPRSLSAWGWAC